MTIERIGYGAVKRDLEEQPNVLRLLVGHTADASADEQLWVLETNFDDISGELIGHAISRLWEAGALDVYTSAIQMKKNRPGVTLTVLVRGRSVAVLEAILFQETTTLRRSPSAGATAQAPPRGQASRNALGSGRRHARLARRRVGAVLARI